MGEKFKKVIDTLIKDLLDRGLKLEEIKKELKEDKIEFKEIYDRHLGEGAYDKWLEELGDFETFEGWYNLFGISTNDRMKNFQLFKLEFNDFFKEEKKIGNFVKDINTLLDNTHHFELDNSVVSILQATKSDKTKLPYSTFFISGIINIKNKTYCGIYIYPLIIEETNKKEIECLGLYQQNIKNEQTLKFDFIDLDKKSDLINFVYSFCNFLNEPDIRIISREINQKNNKRRKDRGLPQLPKENIIKIDGELKKYIDDFGCGVNFSYNHRFYVRGHFMHFLDKKKYKKLYALNKMELKEKKYTKIDGVVRKWKKPFIKGEGLLLKNSYVVTKK